MAAILASMGRLAVRGFNNGSELHRRRGRFALRTGPNDKAVNVDTCNALRA